MASHRIRPAPMTSQILERAISDVGPRMKSIVSIRPSACATILAQRRPGDWTACSLELSAHASSWLAALRTGLSTTG